MKMKYLPYIKKKHLLIKKNIFCFYSLILIVLKPILRKLKKIMLLKNVSKLKTDIYIFNFY